MSRDRNIEKKQLQHAAEGLAQSMPEILAHAQALAQSVHTGAHGRHRAGYGQEFWQYRSAESWEARHIDWRRSARCDDHYVQEREWQIAQNVWLSVEQAPTMQFSSHDVTKAHRAAELALALAIMYVRSGERVGWLGQAFGRVGRNAVSHLAHDLCHTAYSNPVLPSSGMIVWVSDFLMDEDELATKMKSLGGYAGQVALVQILDPVELDFPFSGRQIFEFPTGALSFETRNAKHLRAAYLDRLSHRQTFLRNTAHKLGWVFCVHNTQHAPRPALTAIWHGMQEATPC